jgi:hypothetical protein
VLSDIDKYCAGNPLVTPEFAKTTKMQLMFYKDVYCAVSSVSCMVISSAVCTTF